MRENYLKIAKTRKKQNSHEQGEIYFPVQDHRRPHHEDPFQTPPQQHQNRMFQHYSSGHFALYDRFQPPDTDQIGDAGQRIQFVPIERTMYQYWDQCQSHV